MCAEVYTLAILHAGIMARFNHSHLTVLESDGVATICVELVEALQLERDVVFEVRVSTGTASNLLK